jgi:hypothetical protein
MSFAKRNRKNEMELTNSKRLMYSASYVTTQFTPEEQRKMESNPGGGVPKANLMRALALTAADLERLRARKAKRRTQQKDDEQERLFSVATKLSVAQRPMSTMELASSLAPISFDAIMQFAERATTVKELSIEGRLFLELNNRRRKISPIGRIHLERVEMYPAGVQKGELMFTVPMAPGESVAISHKEWSTSSREFEDIVQDFFESYSERGVAEKSDAAMSSESEAKHSSAVNFGASLSGSYAGVTLTTTLGIADTNDERKSVKQSAQKTREVTEKASARTRKEHKVSVKLETKTGNEDRSAKTITNTAATPVRIDYYRMMRKWRTDLYRYGLRQTYDIAIPLPGVRIWALHQRLADLDKALRTPFVFSLKVEDLNDSNWFAKAAEVGAPAGAVPPPPPEKLFVVPPATIIDFIPENQSGITRFGKIEFDVPAGYSLATAAATADLAVWTSQDRSWKWFNGSSTGNMSVASPHFFSDLNELRLMQSGPMAAVYRYQGISFASLQLTLGFERTADSTSAWKHAAWAAIKASAEARHQEQLARAQEERDRLWRLLNGKDTLSLRRLEREELMRLTMYWLLGPSSELKPGGVDTGSKPAVMEPVQLTAGRILSNEHDFQSNASTTPFPTFTGVSEKANYDAILFGEWVKFMHQAVEWENILYFLYPYFWGSETIGRDKLLFEHADPEHERFLRAGYARIVLPVRPGFEEEFTQLVENGTLSGHPTSPYIPIAQEIANFARTNYSGIPPANPELHARPLLFPEQRATWDLMQETMKAIDAFKVDNGHYPAKLSELPSGSPLDAWGNELVYRMPGLGADYDLVSLGANNKVGGEGLDADISSAAGASLVATWYDYTPTSALDIEVDTKTEDIA